MDKKEKREGSEEKEDQETSDQERQDPNKKLLDSIDGARLTSLLRSGLNRDSVKVTDWEYQPIYGGFGGGRLYRFAGRAYDMGETFPWSLILKAVGKFSKSPDINDDLYDVFYWNREPLAYKSGILGDLPHGLVAPRCLGVDEGPSGGAWVWLEDVKDELGMKWPMNHYGLVGHQLGQFNGAYLVDRPLPNHPGLSKKWMAKWVNGMCGPPMSRLPGELERPLVKRAYPADIVDDVFVLWEERDTFLEALDRLPKTFCHLDAHRRNLLTRRNEGGEIETVAIDWAFSGIEAIGSELLSPVATTLHFLDVELERTRELEEIVFEGYLEGLADAGWKGDPRIVRLGYTAASALRYVFAYWIVFVDEKDNENIQTYIEPIFGRSIGEIMDGHAESRRYLLGLADEARELMNVLS